MRLDRFISQHSSRKQARRLIACGDVAVNGKVITDGEHEVSAFCTVELANQLLQKNTPSYFMLHKPTGYVSATVDDKHLTVMTLLNELNKARLHIAGRLDRNSSGLLLLTDDGQWSRHLTEPGKHVPKTYLVTTRDTIHPDTKASFAKGIFFEYENITTKPVELEQLSPNTARLTLYEGRYHQIKRMFGRFRNPVTHIHREEIGSIKLDPHLEPGDYRALSNDEIKTIRKGKT